MAIRKAGQSSPLRQRWDALTRQIGDILDNRKIAGHPIRWYLTGWRGGVLALIVAVLYPFVVSLSPDNAQTLISTGIAVGIYVLLALGLNIVVGYAGLLDLGYVAFFVLGAYTIAVGTGGIIKNAAGQVVTIPQFNLWILLIVGALIAGIFGVLLGAPTLRLRGDYLAIVTLGFGEIVPIVFNNVPFFYGAFGLTAVPPAPIQTPIGIIDFGSFTDHTAFYLLVLALIALVVIFVIILRDSSLGRAWIAIREDETAAAASGVNLVRTKLLAFGMGATMGGLGGVLQGSYLSHVDPGSFNFNISISILAMIVLGGIGSLPGVILGAIVFRFFDVYLLGVINDWISSSFLVADAHAPLHFLYNLPNQAQFLITGVVLLLMIVFRPQGFIPNIRRQRELKGEGVAAEALSVVGVLEAEEVGETAVAGFGSEDITSYAGPGSDALGREE
jgi:ABC-type branched-subunit amino acid transport system permease subunit